MSSEALVYAGWAGLEETTPVGVLRSNRVRKSEHFSFSYHTAWLQSAHAQKIDPDLQLFTGEQHSQKDQNFRAFLDSCPDRWGRLLMNRREALYAKNEERRPRSLTEMDYLLGVHDRVRMGGLRFKREANGPFVSSDDRLAAPPMSSLAELAYAAKKIEDSNAVDDPDYMKWLHMLMSPGSSLGGARPKASVVDGDGDLCIAKFPSKQDDYDYSAWEYVTHQLAIDAGINMADCQIQRFNSEHHTFITKRFDRYKDDRLHFSSAMTQLGYYDGDYEASYLEIAQFLTEQGSNTKKDLAQLWRRIVFNIAVSNTDDHLRNHGFLFDGGGWALSPAYDINPNPRAHELHLAINETDAGLDYHLAMSVIALFQLSKKDAENIKKKVIASVSKWDAVAAEVGISRAQRALMSPAFNV
ncbi:HipA domain-containing protein [bacterium]|nr:HipA domain-containing protein [bacterium]